MKIDFPVMLDIVNLYCNQNFTPKKMPPGYRAIIDQMCSYTESSLNSNKKSESIGQYSYTLDEKDLFQKFGGLLSPYKRLRTL
jgi:hypothetical protein